MPSAEQLRAQAAQEAAEAEAAGKRCDALLIAAMRAEAREQQENEANNREAHSRRLHDQVAAPLGLTTAQHEVIYTHARAHGQLGGNDEVEMFYRDFAVLAGEVLAAGSATTS